MSSITLTQKEIEEITHLKKPAFQLKFLKQLGSKEQIRPDNNVLVLRHDVTAAANDAENRPQLKSARR